MSSSYKFNFRDLSRFMEDFFYLLQKGGKAKQLLAGPEAKQSTVERIIKYVVLFLKLVLIVVVLYTLYIVIFKGYPRIAINFLTLSFSHKEKLDDFLKERNLLIGHLKFLASPFDGACVNPYDVYRSVYGEIGLQGADKQFEDSINETYKKFKYDDKYQNAIKEYYIFHNTLLDTASDDVVNNGKTMHIPNIAFYELLATYLVDTGEIDRNDSKGVEKSSDALMQEVYTKKKSIRQGMVNVRNALDHLGQEVQSIVNSFSHMPVTSYIMIPDEKAGTLVLRDFSAFKKQIQSKSIYTTPYEKLSDFGWCMIEYINAKNDSSQYQTFANQIPPYTDEDVNRIIYYLNLPRAQKTIAENRVMNSANREFFEYVKKRPLFAHIYFAQQDIGNKNELYAKVIRAYRTMCECNGVGNDVEAESMKSRLSNLQTNGYFFKQLITSAAFLHLFLNVYREELTRMYNKQIISSKRFFTELWNPFVEDIFQNRIGTYVKKTFSSEGMGGSYKRFNVWYKQLGNDLNSMIKAVFLAFFTSAPVEQPQPTETDAPADQSQEQS